MPTKTAKPARGKAAASKAAAPEKPAPKATKATKVTKPKAAAAPTKPAPKAATKAAAKPASKKRKAEDDEAEPEPKAAVDAPKAKKPKTEPKKAAPKATKKAAKVEERDDVEMEDEPKAKAEPKSKPAAKPAAKPKAAPRAAVKTVYPAIGKKINDAPTQVLDVYVFGEGSSGELALGSKIINGKKPIDVKRPRLNENLSAKTVGVVQVSCGGMHAIALTRDNKILTWGVNDQGALGRDTNWDGGLRDMDKGEDSDSEDEDDDTGINPRESTPTALSEDHFAPGTKFVQVVASDSASFVLTEDGRVYGWGTFRSSDGVLGFTESIHIQTTPMLLPTLKNIKSLSAGSNHILALDHKGNVLAWGCGQQNQLGRRIIERNKLSSLTPQGVGLPRGKIAQVATGSYHSFAIDKEGHVWGWGLNNFGEIGVEGNAGEEDAVILKPSKITALDDVKIVDIDGGEHHSLACSSDGKLLTWGRVDGYQVGFEFDKLTKENTIYDERGSARILFKPTAIDGVSDVVSVAAGTDNSFAVTGAGKVYSWGFSSNYQTGQGTFDDVHTPTLIDNSAIREKKIIGAGAGGQFSVLVAVADAPLTNGVNGIH